MAYPFPAAWLIRSSSCTISTALIESNENWINSPEKADIIAIGLAPTDPYESAILKTLTAGTNYTAVLRGVNNTTGIGLVEVYDLEPTNDTHLANISGRAFVSTRDDVLIGGVIVRCDAPEQVLFRAIGPSLAAKGLEAGSRRRIRNHRCVSVRFR